MVLIVLGPFRMALSKRTLLAAASVLWIIGWDRFWTHFGRWIVSESSSCGIRSKNILATFSGLEEKRPLYFVMHCDSKSQYLNFFARASCLLLGSLSAGIFSLWVLSGVSRNWMGSTSATLPTWRQGCFFLTVRLNGLFIFTRNGNDSDGAVDNAPGVGIPALSLTSVSGEGWRLHTPRDRFSLLDERGLEEMGKFLLATVQWLETGRQE